MKLFIVLISFEKVLFLLKSIYNYRGRCGFEFEWSGTNSAFYKVLAFYNNGIRKTIFPNN